MLPHLEYGEGRSTQTGGAVMFIKVVYPDGTAGKVKSSMLDGLMKAGEIVAFRCSEGWVEARRKNKSMYRGINRREAQPEMFFARF